MQSSSGPLPLPVPIYISLLRRNESLSLHQAKAVNEEEGGGTYLDYLACPVARGTHSRIISEERMPVRGSG